MRLHEFEVFHLEKDENGKYTNRVIDSQEPIVGKQNAVVFSRFLMDEGINQYHDSRREGRGLPPIYHIRNLKTGRLMNWDGSGSGLGFDMEGLS